MERERPARAVYVVPNFHPACMGWLVPYDEERQYCLNTYLAHLDRVRDDPAYKFVLSEIPHLITMLELEPERFAEFTRRLAEGRVEVVNAFVLEPTINLSGGEALVQQGVQGLSWYARVMGVKPRFCWMIDVTGWHEQMAQIVDGLGLDGFVYCRYNPTGPKADDRLRGMDGVKDGSALHWIESPDGTRTLAFSPGHYADHDFKRLFTAAEPLPPESLEQFFEIAEANAVRYPEGVPILILAGSDDYSLPFRCREYPRELIETWNRMRPDLPLTIATMSEYLAALRASEGRWEAAIPVWKGGSAAYGWPSFWVSVPHVKQAFRRSEHRLQSAEAAAAVGSLAGSATYPAQELADAWFLLALNMDRNTLWGAAVDAPFTDERSWDARDRFDFVDAVARAAFRSGIEALGEGRAGEVTLFNPVNGSPRSPVELVLPEGRVPADLPCQVLGDGRTVLAEVALPSVGVTSVRTTSMRPGVKPPARWGAPGPIETDDYVAAIDPDTGALTSLVLKRSGREMLGGPANVILCEAESQVHRLPSKSQRRLVGSSNEFRPVFSVTRGDVATVVEVQSAFHGGGVLRRTMRFYHRSPRIDFVTETNGLPAWTILSAEFPWADDVAVMRRGIPYGISVTAHDGGASGIHPVIHWSHYAFAKGGGAGLFDRGVPAREVVGRTTYIIMQNACEEYLVADVTHMNDRESRRYEYALYCHDDPWESAAIVRAACEYNTPIGVADGVRCEVRSFLETSENLIVHALRRVGDEIEIRMVECLGTAAAAWVSVALPHGGAALTDLVGGRRRPLAGGPRYEFDVRAQEIVTLRLKAPAPVPSPEPLRSFGRVIPEHKREFMNASRDPEKVGHPAPPERWRKRSRGW